MPIYEYRCEACQEPAELLHPAGIKAPPPCPTCGAQRLRRVFSRVAVHGDRKDRLRDLSWVDRNARNRLKKKLKGGSLLG